MFAPQTTYTAGPGGYVSSGQPIDVTVLATASTGNAVGDVVLMPVPSFNTTTGEAYWLPTAQVSQPATANFSSATRRIFGVCLTSAAAGATMKVRLRGVVNAKIAAGYTAGIPLNPTNTANTLTTTAGTTAGNVIVALLLETTSTAETKAVMFDGVFGFGVHSS